MKFETPEENLTCCTTIRISLDTRALLSEIQAKHFLKEREELKTYNEVIRYLHKLWSETDYDK